MAEDENQAEPTEEAPKKSSKKLLFIIIGVVVLLLAIGTPIAFFALKGSDKADSEEIDPEVAQKQEQLLPEGFDDEDELDEDEEPLGAFYPMDTFVVNLSGQSKYMRLQVQLEFESRDIPRRFYARGVVVRDAVLKLLTSKAPEEISGPDGKEQLRDEIKETINDALRKELVKKVYFTQFIIQ